MLVKQQPAQTEMCPPLYTSYFGLMDQKGPRAAPSGHFWSTRLQNTLFQLVDTTIYCELSIAKDLIPDCFKFRNNGTQTQYDIGIRNNQVLASSSVSYGGFAPMRLNSESYLHLTGYGHSQFRTSCSAIQPVAPCHSPACSQSDSQPANSAEIKSTVFQIHA